MASIIVPCPLCGIPSPSLKLYVSHLRSVHGKDPNFNVMCGIDGCREVFRSFAAFNSHIYRHHRVAIGLERSGLGITATNESMDIDLPGSDSPEPDADPFLTSGEDYRVADQANTTELSQQERRHSAAMFLLNLKEGHQVSQVAVKDVIAGCRLLFGEMMNDFSTNILDILRNNGVIVDTMPGLTMMLGTTPDPFVGIDTDYLYEKFCRDHLGYLVSCID